MPERKLQSYLNNIPDENTFLPVSAEECSELGWDAADFVYVCGDAYVDHPSFGASIITRVLQAAGWRVAMLCQPDWKSADDFKRFGRPRLGFLVSAGNIDSMVAHYTSSKSRRSYDYYSPNGKTGLRPDRALTVYCNRCREAYPDVPIISGGLEASLRRFAHYDYWSDKVRRSVLLDSRCDLLIYGMGERAILRIAELLGRGVPVSKIHDVRGTSYICRDNEKINYPFVDCGDYSVLSTDKKAYAEAFGIQYRNMDSITAKAVVEHYGNRIVVQNPPAAPLERDELDAVYALPYMRNYHPMYESCGGIPAIKEVKFSITHNRGCFGGCSFCALAFHQGRAVRSRSIESCVNEAKLLTCYPDFKGYIHDVGGPTANFRYPSCKKQLTDGVCPERRCLVPNPCPNLIADESEYTELLKAIEKVEGVRKVFIRSGIRFDYMMYDHSDAFMRRLVRNHVSGQLKVAPEHCSDRVLKLMGKPSHNVYDSFRDKYFELCRSCGLEQYLVPYLISSHPGSTLDDAMELALYLKHNGGSPEQVQEFYPTPGTASTVMYYTGYDPFTMKEIFCEHDPEMRRLQRALLQYNKPENLEAVKKAIEICGRGEELIAAKNSSCRNSRETSKKAGQGGNGKYSRGKQHKSH